MEVERDVPAPAPGLASLGLDEVVRDIVLQQVQAEASQMALGSTERQRAGWRASELAGLAY